MSFIDRDRYPIHQLGGDAAKAVIAEAQRQISITGAAELPGFITPAGVATLVADAESLAERVLRLDAQERLIRREKVACLDAIRLREEAFPWENVVGQADMIAAKRYAMEPKPDAV